MIYTLGYQRHTPDTLSALLDSLRVESLIDVRSSPSSRKPGFSRKALGFELSTMKNIDKGVNPASVNLAFQVSRLACAPFDDVVSGRYPLAGTCPHCGRGPEVGVRP